MRYLGARMDYKNKKRAFTLAEVMIVLLVLTLLLAVFAPFITKRRSTGKKADLWRWSTRNYLAGPMDAYFNPTDDNGNVVNASLFVGLTPDSEAEINDIYLPLGKIIIRSGYIDNNSIQHQIQLRHGRANYEDIGTYAGSLLVDNANILFGSMLEHMVPKRSDASYPMNNISFGFEALNSIGDRGAGSDPALNNIAIGVRALDRLVAGDNNVAIGAAAGSSGDADSAGAVFNGSRNTMIGYNAGFDTISSDNTLIGYKSTSGSGDNNVFIGANTGQQANMVDSEGRSNNYRNNTAIGYNALSSITGGETGGDARGVNNVAIGAGALKNLQKGSHNLAIGYNACANITNQSYKTCIGANSGPAADSPVFAELGMGIDDKALRTYIGTNPNLSANGTSWGSGVYGGDAVLEIHNVGGANARLNNAPSVISNTTTVINGNLVVMGNTYLTVGNFLYPFTYDNNIFGADIASPCSNGQTGYAFSIAGACAPLANLSGVSDRRLKNIGSSYRAGLDEINKIQVYDYTFKADKSKTPHTGVIAQQLQKVFPNAVFTSKDGFLQIRWDEMFYACINAIKELNSKMSSLLKQAVNLENKIDRLEKENKDLQAQSESLAKRVVALKTK